MDEITGQKCGSRYLIDSVSIPLRDTDTLKCEVCGTIIKEWNCSAIYFISKILEKKRVPKP